MIGRRVLFVASVALVVSSCGGGGAEPVATAARYTAMADGLCRAADRAGSADREGARAAFFDRAHQPLHELAAETADHDRAIAARVLEAKQAVEAALDGSSSELSAAFDDLLVTTDAALTAIDAGSLPCRPDDKDDQ